MKKIKKGSLHHYLLFAMEKSIEAGFSFADFFDNPGKFAWTTYRTSPSESSLYRAVRQLREYGYIETPKNGRKIMLKLTQKGKDEVILRRLLENQTWDNKWRIVIFDIPEKQRHLRRAFRAKLREWEFTPLQKSVWVSKKDALKELKKFMTDIGIEDWVKVFEAEAK